MMPQKPDDIPAGTKKNSTEVEPRGLQYSGYAACEKKKSPIKYEPPEKLANSAFLNKVENDPRYSRDYLHYSEEAQWPIYLGKREKSSSPSIEEVKYVEDPRNNRSRTRNASPGKRDLQQYWNRFDLENRAIDTSRTFTYSSYNTCADNHSYSPDKFSSRKNEKGLEGASRFNEWHFKPRLILRSPRSNSRSLNTGDSSYSGRSKKRKKKSHRVARSLEKFRNIYSMDELKMMLKHFKIYNGDEVDKGVCEHSRKVVPAYFVLKLAEKSRNHLKSEENCLSPTQSFKLIFANDDFKKRSRGKKGGSIHYKPFPVVEMSDKIVQTNPFEEIFGRDLPKLHDQNIKMRWKEEQEKSRSPTTCYTCLKMEEDFKVQREFNSSLLEQIKNMSGQLTALIVLLNCLCTRKNDKDGSFIKGRFLSNVPNLKEPIFPRNKYDVPSMFKCVCPVMEDWENVGFGGDHYKRTLTSEESIKVLRNCYEAIGKSVSAIYYPSKNTEVYYFSNVESSSTKDRKFRKKSERTISSRRKVLRRQRSRFCIEGKKNGKICLLKKRHRSFQRLKGEGGCTTSHEGESLKEESTRYLFKATPLEEKLRRGDKLNSWIRLVEDEKSYSYGKTHCNCKNNISRKGKNRSKMKIIKKKECTSECWRGGGGGKSKKKNNSGETLGFKEGIEKGFEADEDSDDVSDYCEDDGSEDSEEEDYEGESLKSDEKSEKRNREFKRSEDLEENDKLTLKPSNEAKEQGDCTDTGTLSPIKEKRVKNSSQQTIANNLAVKKTTSNTKEKIPVKKKKGFKKFLKILF